MGLNHVVNEDLMNTNMQYQRLNAMHDQLEKEIDEVSSHSLIDAQKLKLLKRKKLLVADEMFLLDKKSL